MKKLSFGLSSILLLLVLGGCGSDDSSDPGSELQGIEGMFCQENYSGPAAAYWNMANGIFIPLNQVPMIQSMGGAISIPNQPLLSLRYPQGYIGEQVPDSQNLPVGVDIKRLDERVFFRWIPNLSFVGITDFDQIIAQEINTMFAEVGYNPGNGFRPVCSRNESSPFESLLVNFNGRVIEFGEFTGMVWVRSVVVPGLGTVNSAIQTSVAPTAEFDARALDTFLPFNFQLLVRPDGGGFIDNDGDGTPSHLDPDDNDPNVPRNTGG